MPEKTNITLNVPEPENKKASTAIVEAPTTAPNKSGKRSYNSVSKKDEKTILEGLRAFRPIYEIAESIGVCRQTLYKYIHEHMELEYKSILEGQIDIGEKKLFDNVLEGNQNAIEFFLRNRAKNRGYGEKLAERIDLPIINIGRIDMSIKEKDAKKEIEEAIDV